MIQRQRLPYVFLAFFSLIIGVTAGLVRIGWNITLPNAVAHHGAIMVAGFIGTLISLEKVIPLKKTYLYVVPAMSGASTILFLLGVPIVGFSLLILASIGLIIVFSLFLRKDKSEVHALMLSGATFWLMGNIQLVSTKFYPSAFNWWMSFALFIITSERLELMKFLPVTRGAKMVCFLLLLLVALGCFFPFHGLGTFVTSAGLAGIALWLMKNDLVGISITKTGLTRYVGVALLSGYAWLLFTAVFQIASTNSMFSYDIVVHSFFIGFVLSMIFAHGPIILPGVLGILRKPYSPLLYIALVLLHSSLILRVLGDILLINDFRTWSGVLTALAMLSYFGILATITLKK